MAMRRLKIGIDVGGTFTHAVAVDVGRTELVGKAVVPTTHGHEDGVAAGVVASMHRLLAEAQIAPEEVVLIAHSTTQATNALLEGDVAKVGILALGSGAQGMRARREARLGTVQLGPGAALETVFRFLDVANGFDAARARELLQELVAEGARAVVAAEPFSVDRPENEQAVVRIAEELGVPVTATSSLTQLYGLRMRTLTAAVNASMLPIMIETANRTARAIAASGIKAPLMVMRSDGGIMDIEAMRKRPVLTMLSGPAAGVAAALMYERIANGVFVEVPRSAPPRSVADGCSCARSTSARSVSQAARCRVPAAASSSTWAPAAHTSQGLSTRRSPQTSARSRSSTSGPSPATPTTTSRCVATAR